MMLIMCLFEDCNFDPYQKIINSIVIMRNRNIKSIKHSQIIYRKKKKLFINSYSNCFGFYFTFVFIHFFHSWFLFYISTIYICIYLIYSACGFGFLFYFYFYPTMLLLLLYCYYNIFFIKSTYF
jgi:hypothetical protein